MLSVRSGASAVKFYEQAFEAVVLFRLDGDGDSVVARLAVERAEFWVADESPEHANFSPESIGGSTTRMVLITEDPDAVFDRAVQAGATVVISMENQHGWRLGQVLDPFGHHWEICRELS